MHGVFVETRLRHLLATGQARAHVIAPVPWMPPVLNYHNLGSLRRVPTRVKHESFTVEHPRYVVVPKVGMNLAPLTLYRAMRRSLGRLIAEGKRFDVIDAHYFYPDGVAAVLLGRHFGLPVSITARGTDLNVIPTYRVPRRMIQWAARHADALITVCQALKDQLVELGVSGDRVTVLRNGVDLELFRPVNRAQARAALGISRRTLACVGHLIERKGQHHAIRALPTLPDTDLLIVGDGPRRRSLEQLASEMGVADRVRFLGALTQEKLRDIYGAIDALALPSSREGWANVLLEAMACGTPVVASAVWGTPEVVARPEAGVLMGTLDPQGFSDAVSALFNSLPSREATRRYAERFDWQSTSEGQLLIFRNIASRGRSTS